MPGDQVLAQDESDPEAVPAIRQVEEVFENQAQVMVLGLGGREIETTPENPFWVRDKGWTAAGEIETGEELRSYDGQWIPLDSKQLTDRIDTVYNMRVAEDHTYFVGSPLWGFSVWAHNACQLPKPIGGTKDVPAFRNFNDAQRNALHWLNQNGFDASKATVSISKFTGKPYGLKMGNNIGFRVEIDMRFGAHINVFSAKQKGPHYLFNGNASAVDSILRKLFGD